MDASDRRDEKARSEQNDESSPKSELEPRNPKRREKKRGLRLVVKTNVRAAGDGGVQDVE